MNSTEKMEMQVEELQDGGAAVVLPDGEINPQTTDNEGKPLIQKDYGDDDDDDGHLEDNAVPKDATDDEREAIRAARREERKLKKQIHRGKIKESNYLINALKKQNADLAERLARVEQKTSGAELARVDKAIEDAGVQV